MFFHSIHRKIWPLVKAKNQHSKHGDLRCLGISIQVIFNFSLKNILFHYIFWHSIIPQFWSLFIIKNQLVIQPCISNCEDLRWNRICIKVIINFQSINHSLVFSLYVYFSFDHSIELVISPTNIRQSIKIYQISSRINQTVSND